MNKKLLVIVDMNNGFTKEGVFQNEYMKNLIPGINELAHIYEENGRDIVLINEEHKANSLEFKNFPPHCIKGTSEAEIVDELKWLDDKYYIFPKNSTNGMVADDFKDYILDNENLEEVVIVGGVTDICVLELALTMKKYFDQYDKDIKVIVAEDLVDTYDALNHNRDKYNEAAFILMIQAGIEVKCVLDKTSNKTYQKSYNHHNKDHYNHF